MKRCLISYAKNGRERYEDALDRNLFEANKHTDVDKNFFKGTLPQGCPTHQEVPYAFKPYIFKEMFDKGYTQVIWVDSTIVLSKDLFNIWNYLKANGVLAFHNLGHPLRSWISDIALAELKISEEELDDIEQIMACVVGFDISHPVGKKVFDEWYKLAEEKISFQNNGSNRKGFKAHRHDQAVLSGLLWQNDVKLLPYGNLVYGEHSNGFNNKEPYFINKGI